MSRVITYGKNAKYILASYINLWQKSPRRCHSVWTEGNIVVSPFKPVIIPKTTLVDYVWQNLGKWSEKTALVCAVTGKQYTYQQAHSMSQSFASNLRQKFHLRDGDIVGLMSPNVPEFPIALLGGLAAGCIVTAVNPLYTAYEVKHLFGISKPKLVVATPENVDVVKEALKLNKVDAPIVTVTRGQEDIPNGTVSFNELANDVHADRSVLKEVKRKSEDVCILLYSSGTTGLPKAVELTNSNIVANCQQQTEGVILYDDTTSTNQDTVLVGLPMFHSYGLVLSVLQKLSVGLRLVSVPKFNPSTYLNALLKYKVNVLFVAPPTVLFLGSYPEVRSEHFENVKNIMCGAAPLPFADIQRMFEKAKRKLNFLQGYGLTEASPIATVMPPALGNYTSVGFAVPNLEMKIVDSELNALGPNETGELILRGPNIMKGYMDNPESNKQVFCDGRWLRTGDLASIDETGAVTIADRLKELIKVKGYQVPPAELEAVLKEHPGILDAAVIGIEDAVLGEVPKGFVITKNNAKLDSKEILDFVAKRVAPYKRIREIAFVDEIPKNPSGKILRRLLK